MMTTVPIVLTIVLIVLLIKREFLSGMEGPRSRAVLRVLNVAIVPLLVVFLVMVVVQLRSGQNSDIAETASANSTQGPPASAVQPTISAAQPTAASAVQPTISAAQPTAASTATPGGSPIAPTTAATTAPTIAATVAPTADLLAPDVVSQQVSASEAALRTGQIDAVIEYRGGTRSSAELRFDLNTADNGPRLYMTTLYTGTNSTQRYERVVIGDKTWDRSAGGAWVEQATQLSVQEQVQSFLPQAESIQTATVTRNEQAVELHWSNMARTANTLSIDPNSGIPQALQRLMDANSSELTITYSNWNKPIDIQAPKLDEKRK